VQDPRARWGDQERRDDPPHDLQDVRTLRWIRRATCTACTMARDVSSLPRSRDTTLDYRFRLMLCIATYGGGGPHAAAGPTVIAMHIYDGMGHKIYELSLACTTCVCAQSMPLERGANRGLCRTGCSVETSVVLYATSQNRFPRRILGDSFVCMLTCNPKFDPHYNMVCIGLTSVILVNVGCHLVFHYSRFVASYVIIR
jgi:hypothetical protein